MPHPCFGVLVGCVTLGGAPRPLLREQEAGGRAAEGPARTLHVPEKRAVVGGRSHLLSLLRAGTLFLTWAGGSSDLVSVPVWAAGRTAVPVAGRPLSGQGIGTGLGSGTGMPVCPSALPPAAPGPCAGFSDTGVAHPPFEAERGLPFSSGS